MTEKTIDHSPVDIGSGSFDMEKLHEATSAAAAAKPEDRAAVLAEGLEKARTDVATNRDNAAQDGFKNKKVKREIAPGVTVEETISVYVPPKTESVEGAKTSAPSRSNAPAGAGAQEGSK